MSGCWVCGVKFIPEGPAFKEEHHVFPRNAGGDDGPLVKLCPQHHTAAHQVAIRLQTNKPVDELLVHEPKLVVKKVAYLARAIVKAEALVEGDPNKSVTHSMKLTARDQQILGYLKSVFPKKSRSEIIRAAILVFATQQKRR